MLLLGPYFCYFLIDIHEIGNNTPHEKKSSESKKKNSEISGQIVTTWVHAKLAIKHFRIRMTQVF